MKKSITLVIFLLLVNSAFTQIIDFENVSRLPGWRGGRIKSHHSTNHLYATGYYQNPAIFNTDTLTFSNYPYGLFLVKYDSAQNEEWIKNFDLCQYWEREHSIDLDRSGNIYLATHFAGQAILDDTIYGTPASCNNNTDFFINKYAPSGNLLWGMKCGGTSVDRIFGLKTDNDGNVIIVGNMSSNGTINGKTINNSVSLSNFVAKMDSNGQVLWSKLSGDYYNNRRFMGLDLDENGNIYVAGNFQYSFTVGTNTLTPQNTMDTYVLKFDSLGNNIWAQSISCDDYLELKDIKAYNNQIFVIGDYKGTLKYQTDSITSDSSYNNIIMSLNSNNGAFVWLKDLGGGYDDFINEIDGDNQGRLFIAAVTSGDYFIDSIQYSGIGYHLLLLCLDFYGNVIDVLENSYINSTFPNNTSVDVNDSNQVYITGEYHGTGNLGTVAFSFNDGFDLYMSKINLDSLNGNNQDSIDIIASVLSGCSPLTVSFREPSNLSFLNYEWDLGDTVIITTADSVTHIYNDTGSYTITLITSDFNSIKDTIKKTHYINVFGSYDIQLPDIVLYHGDSALIFGSYKDTTGVYYDSLLTLNGCDSILHQQLIISGYVISDNKQLLSVSIYPNPANELLYIDLGKKYEEVSLELVDLRGRKVYDARSINKNQIQFDLGKLPEGIYILHIIAGNKNAILKVVKKK
ncbi:T9SS type A sorting domain-containing protein [candidate division KSB1 bacterium]